MTATITTFHPPLSQPGFRLFDGPLCDVADVSAGQIGVVGMPSDWTHSSRLGTRFGPEALRKATTLMQSMRPQGVSFDPDTRRRSAPADRVGWSIAGTRRLRRKTLMQRHRPLPR